MRKNVLRIFSLLLIIIVLLMAVSCDTDNMLSDFFYKIECTLHPEQCYLLFGCTPEEFFDLELDIYEIIGDFRNEAKISSDGSLILILSNAQRLAFMNSDLFDFSEYSNIEVSYEDRYVIVNGFDETAYEDVKASFIVANNVCIYLMLQNDPAMEEITIEYIIRDGITKEVYYSITWPQHEVNIPISEYNFSPLPE